MATAQQIHKILGKIGSDPTLIDKLLAEKDHSKRKAMFVADGILTNAEKGPTRQEVENEIKKLLAPVKGGATTPAGGRVVEWVGAIGSAAGGAAGAACGHE